MNEIKATIDIGSNSVLLLAGFFNEAGFNEILNEAEVAGLGKGLDQSGEFSLESKKNCLDILRKYRQILNQKNITPSQVLITATEAARVAKNSRDFFSEVKNELGFDIKIISSQGEAYYSALGVTLGRKKLQEEIVIMDIGGASTELIKLIVDPFSISTAISIPIGSVRAKDWTQKNTLLANFERAILPFTKDLPNFSSNRLVGIAGTITAISNIILGHQNYQDANVAGQVFSLATLKDFIFQYQEVSMEELLKKFPFLGKRANTLISGAQVALFLLEKIAVQEIEVSTYGLRYGTLVQGEIDSRFLE